MTNVRSDRKKAESVKAGNSKKPARPAKSAQSSPSSKSKTGTKEASDRSGSATPPAAPPEPVAKRRTARASRAKASPKAKKEPAARRTKAKGKATSARGKAATKKAVSRKAGPKSGRKAPLAAGGRPAKRSRAARASRKPVAKRAVLPGPKIKRAAKKAPKKVTTQEKLKKAERKAVTEGRRPLDGIRVLDLSRLLPGPYATHILANFGAEVIKIEKPGEGDYMREYLPRVQGCNAAFLTINRGKKSLAIDLKQADGKKAFLQLIKQSDVILDGFRPGVMERLGLGYAELSQANPKLVYVALTGYGQTGQRSGRAGHDLNYVALAGMLDLLGESNGMPAVPGIQLADVAAGALPTVIGVLLALHHRSGTGKGQMVDVSMFDSLLGLMPVQVANYTATKRRPKRGHERLFGRYACYNVYPVRNGRYVAVAALEPKFWRALCTTLNRPDLIEDQYVEGDAQQILMAELTRTFQKKEVSDWMEIFGDEDVCVTEVREISRAVQDEAVSERAMFTPVRGKKGIVYEQLGVFPKLDGTPGYIAGDAPARGEHSRQVLKSLGYEAERIDTMIKDGICEETTPG